MLRRNKLLTGIVTGIAFPIIIFVLLWEINIVLVDNRIMPNEGFKARFLWVLSVVANVIPAGMYVKSKKDEALKGIVGVTLLIVFGLLIYYNKNFFNT